MTVTSKCLVLLLLIGIVYCSSIHSLGNASTYINTNSEVYDVQNDVFSPGHILYGDGRVLVTTDGNRTWPIVGNTSFTSGYKEGVSGEAIFYGITSFQQISKTIVLVVDKWNHCVRFVDRLTYQTSVFAGECTKNGFKNAYSKEAMFFYPTGLLQIGSTTIIADTYNMAIRLIISTADDRKTFVSTLSQGGILKYPQFLATDSRSNLYVTVMDGIVKIPTGSDIPVALTSLKGGFLDGPIGLAKFYSPKQLVMVDDSLLVVVDSGNSRVRAIDMVAGGVTTLVQLASKMSRSILVTEDKLYVGVYRKILQMKITVERTTPNSTATNQMTVPATFALPTTTATTTRTTAAFTAQYSVDCSKLVASEDISVLKAVLAYRLTQLEKICQSDCRRSATLRVSYKCSRDTLNTYWPIEISPTNEGISKEFRKKVQDRLKAMDLTQFTVTVLSMTPPVVKPEFVCNAYVKLQTFIVDSDTNNLSPDNSKYMC